MNISFLFVEIKCFFSIEKMFNITLKNSVTQYSVEFNKKEVKLLTYKLTIKKQCSLEKSEVA